MLTVKVLIAAEMVFTAEPVITAGDAVTVVPYDVVGPYSNEASVDELFALIVPVNVAPVVLTGCWCGSYNQWATTGAAVVAAEAVAPNAVVTLSPFLACTLKV